MIDHPTLAAILNKFELDSAPLIILVNRVGNLPVIGVWDAGHRQGGGAPAIELTSNSHRLAPMAATVAENVLNWLHRQMRGVLATPCISQAIFYWLEAFLFDHAYIFREELVVAPRRCDDLICEAEQAKCWQGQSSGAKFFKRRRVVMGTIIDDITWLRWYQ